MKYAAARQALADFREVGGSVMGVPGGFLEKEDFEQGLEFGYV